MKTFFKIFLLLSLIFLAFGDANGEVFKIPGASDISKLSINDTSSGNAPEDLNRAGLSILQKAKVVVQGLLVIFLVYAGIQMIISMGHDEEKLSAAKRQIWQVLVAIIFINIPGALFNALHPDNHGIIDSRPIQENFVDKSTSFNMFFNDLLLAETFDGKIIGFFKVLLYIAAVIMIIMAGIKIMTARGRDDQVKEGKTKIIYSMLALIFAGIIEAWKYIAFDGSVKDGLGLFGTLANLALFFAGPTAIFFLTLAGYYYITSNGEEDKIKKAKSIVINTVLATIILLASYTFLLDLAKL